MEIKVVWTRKLGHLWQSLVTDGKRDIYGHGITRKAASDNARAKFQPTGKKG